MKYLYKYPQAAYPYDQIVRTSRARTRDELEYELMDTGVFNDGRYFDVFVKYSKEAPEGLLIRIPVHNRGPEAAELPVLPTLWFRNQWSWGGNVAKPWLSQVGGDSETAVVHAVDGDLVDHYLYCAGAPPLLFTENETNS